MNDDGRTNQDAVLLGLGGHYGAFFDSETLAGTITAPRLPTFADSKGDRTPPSLEDARRLVQGYVEHYNNVRLNSAIG